MVPSGCWNSKRDDMLTWTMQASSNLLASGCSMMPSVCVLRSAFALLPLQPFGCNHWYPIARGWTEHREQPVDQIAPEADRCNGPVTSVSCGEIDSASSHGDDSSNECSSHAGYSEGSSGSGPPVSEVIDPSHALLVTGTEGAFGRTIPAMTYSMH